MLGVGIAGVIVLLAAFCLTRPVSGTDRLRDPAAAGGPTRGHGECVRWTNAAKFGQRLQTLTVKIERAKFGALRVKNLSNEVVSTRDDNLLGIVISVRNHGPRTYPFKNWYGHAFVADNGGQVAAELIDDHDRAYSLLKFDDVRGIEGQSEADEIGPRETVHDTVVFRIPDGADRDAIDGFRLVLPAAAMGLSGSFRFQLPTSMIEAFDDIPADGTSPFGTGFHHP